MAMSILTWAPGDPFGGPLKKKIKKMTKTMKITKNINFRGPGGQNPRSVSRDDSKSPHAVVN